MRNTETVARISVVAGAALALAACASQYKQSEAQIQSMPVNCATAEGDLRMLRSEKASVATQIAMGVTAIAPVGLIAGVASGTEGTKAQIATGEYNRIIDQKIAQIQMTCNVQ